MPFDDNGRLNEHGVFVFATSSLDMLYVIVREDLVTSAPSVFGIASVRP